MKERPPPYTPAHRAAIALLRAASTVHRRLARVLEPSGVTVAQYNVLRILRGAGQGGLATLAIRDRMIAEAAGITRLLDKLERSGHVVRDRHASDRRQVVCRITESGRLLLVALEVPVDSATDDVLCALSSADQSRLASLLESLAVENEGAPGDAHGSARAGQPPR